MIFDFCKSKDVTELGMEYVHTQFSEISERASRCCGFGGRATAAYCSVDAKAHCSHATCALVF